MKFKDMPYTRPDMEKVKKIFEETKEKKFLNFHFF